MSDTNQERRVPLISNQRTADLNTIDDRNEDVASKETQFGYFNCRPHVLQVFANSKCLLVCVALLGLTLGMVVSGLVPVSITTLEKRFSLSGADSGVFAGAYKFSSMLSVIPIAHFSNFGFKSRYLSYGAFCLGFGSLLIVLPQFISEPYVYKSDIGLNNQCITKPFSITDEDAPEWRGFYYMLVLGQTFHGLGGAPIVMLSVTFLDENVSQLASPVYSSIFMMCRNIVGPAIGYIAGGFSLKLYGDILKVNVNETIIDNPKDPRWYGAWWICFLFSAILSVFLSIPIAGFPQQLPGVQRLREKDVDQSAMEELDEDAEGLEVKKTGGKGFTEDLSNLPREIGKLLSNVTYCSVILCQLSEAFMLSAMITFTPKLMESIYNVSPDKASFYSGGILIIGGLTGTLTGGIFIRKLKLRCKGIMILILVSLSLSVIMFAMFLVRCGDRPAFAGVDVTQPYPIELFDNHSQALKTTCNADCHCSSQFYIPVCDVSTKTQYFSPCHAGCSNVDNYNSTTYSHCTCLTDSNNTLNVGVCPSDCSHFYLFYIMLIIYMFIAAISFVPIQQAVLRSVPYRQRNLGFGMYMLLDGAGTIAGAWVIGATFDHLCEVWKIGTNGHGNCVRYDADAMGHIMAIFGVVTKCCGILFLFLAIKTYVQPAKRRAYEPKQELNDMAKIEKRYHDEFEVKQ